MKNKIIIANWKMAPNSFKEARVFFRAAANYAKKTQKGAEIIVAPPFVYLEPLSKILNSEFYILNSFKLGAQDCFWEQQGAYTGEISPLMLKNLGCEYVIVGHSERRKYYNETDEIIAKKLKAVLDIGLTPILCVGENLSERKKGRHFNVVKKQLEKNLKYLTMNYGLEKAALIVAYEPIWAIGTGIFCNPKDAVEMHRFIKNILNLKFKIKNFKLLYGGSVDSKNIDGFLRQPEIDGVLVGGASIKEGGKDFIKILKIADKLL